MTCSAGMTCVSCLKVNGGKIPATSAGMTPGTREGSKITAEEWPPTAGEWPLTAEEWPPQRCEWASLFYSLTPMNRRGPVRICILRQAQDEGRGKRYSTPNLRFRIWLTIPGLALPPVAFIT
jgi:hypothetical protein